MFTYEELKQCVQREIRLRKHVYPNRILTHRMTQKQADREIKMMEAIERIIAEMATTEQLPF